MKKIFLIFTVAIGFLSCETDIAPKDVLEAGSTYTNVSDLQRGMNSVMASYNPYPIINFNSIFTDECRIGSQSGGQEVPKYNMQLTSAVNGNDIWNAHYRTINFANKIIVAANSIPTNSPAEVASLNNIVAQCYALRALCHLDLLTHYATTMEDPSALGVLYVDFVPFPGQTIPRSTVGECFTKLLADLDTAESLFAGAASNKIFMNKEAIVFMRAKVALFTGDNAGAIANADLLIAQFSLADRSQYVNMFNDLDNTEVIFKAERKANNALIGGIWFFTGTGGDFMGLSNSMIDSFQPGDIRPSVLKDDSETAPVIGKYKGSEGVVYMNDVKVMRVSEMYLVKAEAQAKLSQFTAASSTMQALVEKRYDVDSQGVSLAETKSYSTLSDAILDILEERKLELGYEGHRYVDLKRLRAISNVGIERNPLDCGGAAPCELSPSDNRFTLPIPITEINANSAALQNPGY